MPPLIADLKASTEKQLALLRRGVEMMEGGVLATHEQNLATGRTINTTAATLATYREHIAELEDVLCRISVDHG